MSTFCNAYHSAAGSVTKDGAHIVDAGGWYAMIRQHLHGMAVRCVVRTRVNGHSVYLTDALPARFSMDTIRPQTWAVRSALGSVRIFETRREANRYAMGRYSR